MASDDLNAPLGQNKRKKRCRSCRSAAPHMLAGVLGLFGLAGRRPGRCSSTIRSAASRWRWSPPSRRRQPAAKPDDGDGKQHARYDGPAATTPIGDAAAAAAKAAAPPPGSKTITIIDGSSGKRQDVVIPGNRATRAAPQGAGRPAPARDHRATARSRRSAPDGARPSDALRASARSCRPTQERRAAHRHRDRRPRHQRVRHRRRARQTAGAGDASRSRLTAPISNSWRRARAAKATRCCCRCRWSRSTIPTTIPARRRC